ncbi:MAG: PAS domain S-box protein [Bacteroidales bacterium]|nr:PAS domain S-box protein [Bacteroidales bacterium]
MKEQIPDTQILKILEAVKNFVHGDYSVRLDSLAGNEALDSLATGINRMGEELETNLQERKDITRQLEETLYLLERECRLLNTLMEHIPDRLYFKDVENRFIRVSNSTAFKHGFNEPDELIGKSDQDLFSSPHAGNTHSDEERIIKTGKALIDIEEKETWEDGTETWALSSKMPMFDKQGKVIGTFGISRDITRHKQVQEELKEREELLNRITASAKDAIIVIDGQGEVLFWNQTAESLFGYSYDQVRGRNFHNLMAPEKYHAAHQKAFRKFQKTGKGAAVGATLELEALHKDGHTFPVELSLSDMFIKDYWHAVGIIRDITLRKETDRKLEEAKNKAESANRAKSEFLANMSHEIRTPMNAILGFAEILEEQIRDNPRQMEYIKGIRNSGKGLLGLINDILDLSKIEAGKMDIRYEPINPYAIIEEISQIFQVKTREKALGFRIHVDSGLPQSLLFDEIRLRQVLFNLIGNAVKFTSKGEIVVNVKSRNSNEDGSHVDCVLEVIDTGIGIPGHELERIFEPFRQQEGQSTRTYGGTGLGLSITRRQVGIMGGSIEVESTPGKGSAFTVYFPGIQVGALRAVTAQQDDRPAEVRFHEPKILLVEDIESNRQVITGYLNAQNIRILIAENGSTGVDIARYRQPDLILMDMQMPVMDGYEAIRILKSDEQLKRIPVVALTASTMKKDEELIR